MLLVNFAILIVPPALLISATGSRIGVSFGARLQAVGLGALGMGLALLIGFAVVPVALQLSGLVRVLFSAFVTAALVEEAAKALVLLPVLKNEESFPRTAAALKGALAGTGFAVVETLLHIGRTPDIVGIRVLTTWPLHLGAGLLIGYAIAAEREGDRIPMLMGVLAAIAFHGVYDLLLILGRETAPWVIPLLLVLAAACTLLWVIALRRDSASHRPAPRTGRRPHAQPR
ncbi:MAG: PrsW family glutamic-type intramembrane protease [Spirochaetota bacterium]